MSRSRLRNKYLKNKNEENRAIYVKQRNYCVSLLRKSKKKYYENLHERNLVDNKLFWKTIKPSFSDKIVTRDRIHLTENGEVELETAETLNNFFGNVIKNLMIPKYSEYDPSIDMVENRTITAILKYRNHPSILTIRKRKKAQINFCFEEVSIKGGLSGLRQFLATESPLKMMKNAFYFTSKALFVLKIFRFMS